MLDNQINERLDQLLKRISEVQNGICDGQSSPRACDKTGFYQVRAGAIAFVEAVFGKESSLYEQLGAIKADCTSYNVFQLTGVLLAVRDQINSGFLKSVRTMAAAEVFSDFIEQADYLVEKGFKNAAASLVGAVLEDGLRTIAKGKALTFAKGAGLYDLNKLLNTEGVYNELVWKEVDSWRELRNLADHGRFTEFDEQQTKNMISGVREFLVKFL